jgi:hypothetical protein
MLLPHGWTLLCGANKHKQHPESKYVTTYICSWKLQKYLKANDILSARL